MNGYRRRFLISKWDEIRPNWISLTSISTPGCIDAFETDAKDDQLVINFALWHIDSDRVAVRMTLFEHVQQCWHEAEIVSKAELAIIRRGAIWKDIPIKRWWWMVLRTSLQIPEPFSTGDEKIIHQISTSHLIEAVLLDREVAQAKKMKKMKKSDPSIRISKSLTITSDEMKEVGTFICDTRGQRRKLAPHEIAYVKMWLPNQRRVTSKATSAVT